MLREGVTQKVAFKCEEIIEEGLAVSWKITFQTEEPSSRSYWGGTGKGGWADIAQDQEARTTEQKD